jgi:predicted methyltransferase MtxX (methanogen marker protein 4)
MKKFALCVLALVLCVLFAGDVGATGRRKVVEKVVVKEVQPVIVQKQVIQKRVIVQEVQAVEVQRVIVQPVQAVYQLQVRSLGFSSAYSGYCAPTESAQLRQEVEALKLKVEKQELQQKLTAPK